MKIFLLNPHRKTNIRLKTNGKHALRCYYRLKSIVTKGNNKKKKH